MTFELKIECDNAAFGNLDEDGNELESPSEECLMEVARILEKTVKGLRLGNDSFRLLDVNGNHVGYAEFETE